jgi:adenine deaminase
MTDSGHDKWQSGFLKAQRSKPMKRIVLVLTAVMFTTVMAATAEQTQARDAKQVHAEGCVEPGVEAGCLVVKDMRGGAIYNVLIKGQRPGVGEGIEFTGAPHEGPTSCMQGVAVDVVKWTPKHSLNCSQGGPVKGDASRN